MIDQATICATILLVAVFVGGPLWLAAVALDEWNDARRARRRRSRRRTRA